MGELLLVFVDSLPFPVVERHGLLSWCDCVSPLVPGVGYSYNQKAEVLRGLHPDELGYFNNWQHVGRRTIRRRWWWKVANGVRERAPILDKVMHMAVSRLGRGVANIPFEFLGEFRQTVPNPYVEEEPTIFTMGSWIKVIAEHEASGVRDDPALDRMGDRIDTSPGRHFFLALAELDGIGHREGASRTQRYVSHARHVDSRLAELAARFRERWPEGGVVVFSDHGMVDVETSVGLPSSLFDLPRRRRAVYWLDSTMLRVWVDSAEEAEVVRGRLARIPELHLFGETERRRFGIRSRNFGNLLGVVNPGVVIQPNFFGVRAPAGMHGYHPDEPGHFAVVATLGCDPGRAEVGGKSASRRGGKWTTRELHRFLEGLLGAAGPAC